MSAIESPLDFSPRVPEQVWTVLSLSRSTPSPELALAHFQLLIPVSPESLRVKFLHTDCRSNFVTIN